MSSISFKTYHVDSQINRHANMVRHIVFSKTFTKENLLDDNAIIILPVFLPICIHY